MTMERRQLEETIETLVDKHGAQVVLQALAQVCAEKADHVNTNWQDRALAKDWEHASDRMWDASIGVRV